MTWPVLTIEVRQGDEGEAVMAVQEEVNFRNQADEGEGPARLVVDGIFGPLTDDAVRWHQRGVELDDDGIVGPLTWRFFITGFCPAKDAPRIVGQPRSEPRCRWDHTNGPSGPANLPFLS